MAPSRDEIVAAARRYLGTPFLHQGRTPHGIDCIGLAISVAHELQLTTFDITGYSRVPSGRMMSRLLRTHCTEIGINDAQAGDLFHLAFELDPQHIAMVTDAGFIIHSDNPRGVVEHRLDIKWRRRIRGTYRMPGVL